MGPVRVKRISRDGRATQQFDIGEQLYWYLFEDAANRICYS